MDGSKKLTLKNISPLFTEEILHQAVRDAYKKKFKSEAPAIISHSVDLASSKGDGYLGVICRITTTLEDGKVIKVIAKGQPESLSRRKTFQTAQFFAKEVLFYNKIVPAFLEFEKHQRGNKFDKSLLTIPDCYYAMSDGDNDFLVMEDLNEDGFGMAEREVGLDPVQTKAMFEMLARIHGYSLAMKHCNPEKFKEISTNIFEPIFSIGQRTWIEKYLLNLAIVFIAAVEDELKDTTYLEKFIKFCDPETYYPAMTEIVNNKESTCVINHGDVWSTNFMFNNKESICKAIDFQLVRYGSPMLDLSTVIFTCTTSEQRKTVGGVNGLIDIYQRELSRVVTSLGAPESACMTSKQLQELWKQLGSYGLGCSIELLPLSLVVADELGEMQSAEGEEPLTMDDLTMMAEIKNPDSKKRMADAVRLAVDEGVI